MYLVGTAWLVKVGANESRIYPSYLTRVISDKPTIIHNEKPFVFELIDPKHATKLVQNEIHQNLENTYFELE